MMIRTSPGGLDDPQVVALLQHHYASARAQTAPGSAHAMDLSRLKAPDIHFWSAWNEDRVVGVGALRALSDGHGEVKSMHTAEAARRLGVGSAMLGRIIAAARELGMTRLSLETGSWPYFKPAVAFYIRNGFVECGPFGDYKPDPNSLFFTFDLRPS
jgi:putative acetyltransferase